MSRAPYQRMGQDGSSPRGGPGVASGARSPASPRGGGGDAANVKHAARHAGDADDPQAPWLTHLEYSVDPLVWDDDNKFPACPLCQSAFVVSMMGSGRHHCRCWSDRHAELTPPATQAELRPPVRWGRMTCRPRELSWTELT